MADNVAAHEAFWSNVAPKYDTVVDQQIGPGIRAMVRERVEREGRLGYLAEFGCGTGFYTSLLAGKADRVVATDLSPGMLAVARANTRATNVTFQVENCERTSLPDGAFDTAFVSLVLHFTEPAKALAEMHRILKPGGMLLVSNLDPGRARGPRQGARRTPGAVPRTHGIPPEAAEGVREEHADGAAAPRPARTVPLLPPQR
jgi:ubiquinone/menaquinone biosynthesis C-methylase UbiE